MIIKQIFPNKETIIWVTPSNNLCFEHNNIYTSMYSKVRKIFILSVPHGGRLEISADEQP